MSTSTASKFLRDEGTETFNGNELIFKGILETDGGVHLMTGYPGSPVATLFDVVAANASLLKERGIEARMTNNEALAVAAVNGSQMAPLRSMAVFKSVGMHVASDALALGNLAGPHPDGGAVIVIGDDPWSESTQVPADSRFLCRHLFMPTLEPSTPQEAKDFVPVAFELSRRSGLYIGYIITTTLADGGGTVRCRQNHYPLTNARHPIDLDTLSLNLEDTVLLPPRTGRREKDIPARYAKLVAAVRDLNLNPLYDVKRHDELLIVTSGMAFQYVQQALSDLGLSGEIPILKLAVTSPLDESVIVPLLQRFRHVVVAEERRSFVEDQIAQMKVRCGQNSDAPLARLWGKQFPGRQEGFPSALGLNSGILADGLSRFLEAIDSPLLAIASAGIEEERAFFRKASSKSMSLPIRTPAFCPGCPHRDSSTVLLDVKSQFADESYMRKHHNRGAVDLVFHGDTGCYTMLMFEPNAQLMHNYSGMGLGGGTGSGIDPFIRNKQVVFMGDSTFFHSGMTAISNSIANSQDITYIILANGTTAMTGHQTLPAEEYDLLHRPIPAQDIEQVVRSVTGERCRLVRTNPEDRDAYRQVLESTILGDGVKVIIADKECGITYHRRRMREERREQANRGFVRKKTFMNVTPEVCEYCLECTNATGCPGLRVEPSDYGPKIGTDLSWCVNDGACARIGACPSFEEIIVTRKQPPTRRGHKIELADIPEPDLVFQGDVWRTWIAGVGGMGIGTAAAVLVHAAQHDGWTVQFSDKKGLAIRNGGVYSQLTLSRNGAGTCMTVGHGKADLLLGMDMLEAARAADPKMPFLVVSPERTAVVVNTDQTPTIRMLLGEDECDPAKVEATLRGAAKEGQFFAARIASLCERIFGTKLYGNLTMLGIAYQRGLIPLSLDAFKAGIRKTMRVDIEKNLRAFDVGRKLVAQPELFKDLFAGEPAELSLARTVREKAAYLNLYKKGPRKALRSGAAGQGSKRRLPDAPLARTYKHIVYTTLRACRELDRGTMRDIAIRIYDLIRWGGVNYARRYVQRVRRVFMTDSEEHGFAATRAVVWNLAKLMLIKDEFYVADLLTRHEKYRRDRQRYNVNPANGDRIRYKRTFHPRFMGRQVDISPPAWILYMLRKMRFMRRVLPFYHVQDRAFLAWYESVVDGLEVLSPVDYERYLEVLRIPESVTGFAEVRYPKIRSAQARAAQILAQCGHRQGSRQVQSAG